MITVLPSNSSTQANLSTPRLSWSEYEHKVLSLFLTHVKSDWNSDFMICTGPDGLIVGNSFYRSTKETMGMLMVAQDGNLAENISILKSKLEGRVSLLGLNADKLESVAKELLNRHPQLEFKTVPLFQESENSLLPHEIFTRVNLKNLRVEDLKNLTASELSRMACSIFDKLKNNLEFSFTKTDLQTLIENLPPEETKNEKLPAVNNLSWDDLGKKIITLSLMIKQSGYEPDICLYVGSGGNYIGQILSILLGTQDACIMASSYSEEGVKGTLRLAPNISIASSSGFKGKILFIDDLVDSGETLKAIKEYLSTMVGVGQVKSAVIFKTEKTCINPDYAVETKDERWVYFPDEVFERLNLKIIKSQELIGFTEIQILKLAKSILAHQLINPKLKISDETIRDLISKAFKK